MAFIGNQPTAVPLTSSQLADGLITTAKLAADAVTSAKIADSTIVNADIASTTINLTQKVTGTLPYANGGTGLSTLGTAGQALVVNSSATALEYSTVGAQAGQVIQVVSATDSTERTTTSTSYVTSTGLSLSITPSSTSNKIFLISSFEGYNNTPPENTFYTLYRNSTNLGATNGFAVYRASSNQVEMAMCMSHLDSPSSSSAITYAVYFKVAAGTGYVNKGGGNVTGTLTAFEIKG